MLGRVNHVGVATPIDKSVALYRDLPDAMLADLWLKHYNHM